MIEYRIWMIPFGREIAKLMAKTQAVNMEGFLSEN
jgi:hypothetical protein